jgi:hypothetical protein
VRADPAAAAVAQTSSEIVPPAGVAVESDRALLA